MADLMSNIGSQQVIMTLLWVMLTGAIIWGIDNILKRFENTMEDNFKAQARGINDTIRVNFTLLLISVSVYAYFKFYLDLDTSSLRGVLGNLIDLLASIGKFILYLLAYIVHLGYQLLQTDYQPGKPNPDEGVLLGFVFILGYFVVKRLFFRKTPPILWAIIVAFVMLGFNFAAEQTGFDIRKVFSNNTLVQIDTPQNDSTVSDDNQPIAVNPRQPQPTDNNNNSNNTNDELPSQYSDADLLIMIEELETAIENFDIYVRRTEPNEGDYPNDRNAFEQASVQHIYEAQQTTFYKKITDLADQFENKGILQHSAIQTTIKDQLCEYYISYFDDKICPVKDQVFAN